MNNGYCSSYDTAQYQFICGPLNALSFMCSTVHIEFRPKYNRMKIRLPAVDIVRLREILRKRHIYYMHFQCTYDLCVCPHKWGIERILFRVFVFFRRFFHLLHKKDIIIKAKCLIFRLICTNIPGVNMKRSRSQ